MSIEIMAGTWEGFYTYGPAYSPAYQLIKDPFVMELKVDGELITGTCVDRFTKEHFDRPATVEGTLIDGTLSLIKRYPFYLWTDEQDQTFVDGSRPGEGIHYVGQLKRKFFSSKHFAEGTWDISGSYLDEQGNPWYYTCDGDWEMRRVK